MKNLLTTAAVVVAFAICSSAHADNAMSKLGFGGMKKVSKANAMKVRGKGAGGYTISPYVVAQSSEFVNQFASQKAIKINFAAVNSVSYQKTNAVQLSVEAAASTQSLNAAKSDFTFFGPSLPYSYGNYGGYVGGYK